MGSEMGRERGPGALPESMGGDQSSHSLPNSQTLTVLVTFIGPHHKHTNRGSVRANPCENPASAFLEISAALADKGANEGSGLCNGASEETSLNNIVDTRLRYLSTAGLHLSPRSVHNWTPHDKMLGRTPAHAAQRACLSAFCFSEVPVSYA